VIMTRGDVTADLRSFLMNRPSGLGVPSALDQDVENEAVLIDGAPQPVPLAGERHDDLASRAEELHLRALLEPYVTLSSHTAPDVRSSTCTKRQCAKRFARRTRASQSLARLGLRRRRLNLSQAQRTRAASTRLSVQYNADL
jgi:hypothetical protein